MTETPMKQLVRNKAIPLSDEKTVKGSLVTKIIAALDRIKFKEGEEKDVTVNADPPLSKANHTVKVKLTLGTDFQEVKRTRFTSYSMTPEALEKIFDAVKEKQEEMQKKPEGTAEETKKPQREHSWRGQVLNPEGRPKRDFIDFPGKNRR